MYQAFTKVLDSSSVTGSCTGFLIDAQKRNLIVAKHDVLEVYTVVEDEAQHVQPPPPTSHHHMILEAVYYAPCGIEAMEAVRFPAQPLDAVVLGFADAKVSVLMWDHSVNNLKVKCLHFMEDPVVLKDMPTEQCSQPLVELLVDPGSQERPPQCLVLALNRRFLFVLQYAKAKGTGEWGWGTTGRKTADPPKYPLENAGMIDLAEQDLLGVRSVVFVQGYYKPTLMVLHEVDQAWAGRLSLALGDEGKVKEKKHLSCGASILSLTLTDGRIDCTNLSITSRLPYNAAYLYPVRSEPYGAIMIAPNTIAHLAQNEQSSYAVHVNNYGKAELFADPALQTPFGEAHLYDRDGVRMPMYFQKGNAQPIAVRLVLDLTNARVTSIPGDDSNLFLVLSTGEACYLRISRNRQNIGTVSDLSFRLCEGIAPLSCLPRPAGVALPSCPIPSSICAFTNFVFVGSRTGDSLLLRRDPQTRKYSKVLTLLNTGPILDISFGDSSVDKPSEQDDDEPEMFPNPSLVRVSKVLPVHLKPSTDRTFAQRHAAMELVAATGKGKDGAVCILSRTIKPLTLCSQKMNVQGLWSFRYKPKSSNKRKREEAEGRREDEHLNEADTEKEKENGISGKAPLPGHHDYLAVSSATTGGTMFLKAGETDIWEDVSVPFSRERTVCIGTALNDRVVVQVTLNKVYAYDALTGQTAELSLPLPASAHQAQVLPNQACVLMTDGSMVLVSVFHVTAVGTDGVSGVESLHLEQKQTPLQPRGLVTAFWAGTVAREDPFTFALEAAAGGFDSKPEEKNPEQGGSEPQAELLTVATTGTPASPPCITVYNVSSSPAKTLLTYRKLQEFPEVLTPSANYEPETSTSSLGGGPDFSFSVSSVFFGRIEQADPGPHLLFGTGEGDLYCYKGFVYRGELRFQRVADAVACTSGGRAAEAGTHSTAPPRLRPPSDLALSLNPEYSDAIPGTGAVYAPLFRVTPCPPAFSRFSNVFGHEGIFFRTVRGGVFGFSEKSFLRLHEMVRTHGVADFAPIHTPCCKGGFVVGLQNELRIQHLTWHKRLNVRCQWPTRKILLKSTPHQILFDPHNRTYTLIVSSEVPFKPVKTAFDSDADAFLKEESENNMKEVSQADGNPIPCNGRFELLLYSAHSWKPFTVEALKENEKVLCCGHVALTKPDPMSVFKLTNPELVGSAKLETVHLQACGTGFPIAEDVPCRGRIVFLRVRVGRTKDDRILEIDHDIITKGPVTDLTCSDGYLFAAVAGQIHVYGFDWTTRKLVFVSWCDVSMYTTALSSFKSFVVAGDIFNSVRLLRWSQAGHRLSVLAHDPNRIPISCCDFTFDRSTLIIVAFDENGNLITYAYDPGTAQITANTQVKLKPISDMHIDTTTAASLKLRTFRLPQPDEPEGEIKPGARTALIFGTKEGAICTLQPIAEHIHRDLHWLYTKMITELEHFAGLHPRGSRRFRGKRQRMPDHKNRRSVVMDMNLISRILKLPVREQEHLVAASGLGSVEHLQAVVRSVRQEASYL